MAQERKQELVNLENALKALTPDVLSECSEEDLVSIRTNLDNTLGKISSIIRVKTHQHTHFHKKQ